MELITRLYDFSNCGDLQWEDITRPPKRLTLCDLILRENVRA